MARPLRLIEPDVFYFITNRTFQSRLLLTPSKHTNNEVGAALARASEHHGIKLFAYIVASNHIHLIVKGTCTSIPAFMRDFKSWSAKKVGMRIGWSGSIWGGRYSCSEITDESALRGRYLYVFQHGVKEGLVDNAREWPGLHCITHLLESTSRVFIWFDATGYWRAKSRGEKPRRSMFEQPFSLRLEPVPFLTFANEQERVSGLNALVEAAHEMAMRGRNNRPSLGVRAVLAQNPLSEPVESKKSNRPVCHASTRCGMLEYLAKYRGFVAAFRTAVVTWREQQINVFPLFAHPPGGLLALTG
jgi:REP element-mobilizing transposase RayT